MMLLLCFAGITTGYAQLQAEIQPMAGYPFMLSGRNKSNYGLVTARLQVGYLREAAPWDPYLAASISGTELPLHNQEIKNLAMPVLNISFKAGLNLRIMANEERRSYWTAGGGIGICMLRPDGERLTMDGQEGNIFYTQVMDKPWFPEVEIQSKWIIYPMQASGFYCGTQVLVEAVWLRDNNVRYTTTISGKQYNLNFNDFGLWPSVGGVIGWRF